MFYMYSIIEDTTSNKINKGDALNMSAGFSTFLLLDRVWTC